MPNSIGHFGAQGVATRLLIKEADPKWILAGCIIPDVPWIMRRAAQTLLPAVDRYDLRLYAITQSTLLLSLVLAGALALLASRPRLTFLVLGLNCVIHLILDACRIKWGGGIHRIVPKANPRARTFPVKIRLENEIVGGRPLVKAGMFARVSP